MTSRLALLTHMKLTKVLKPRELDTFMKCVEDSCHSHRLVLKKRKECKIERLIQKASMNSDWITKMKKQYQFYSRVINLSDVQLNVNEQRRLEKGLKFVVPPSNAEIAVVNLTADLATRLRGNGNKWLANVLTPFVIVIKRLT